MRSAGLHKNDLFYSLNPPRQHQRHHLLFLFLVFFSSSTSLFSSFPCSPRPVYATPPGEKTAKEDEDKQNEEGVEGEVWEDDGDDDGETERRE